MKRDERWSLNCQGEFDSRLLNVNSHLIADCLSRVKFVHCDVTNWNDQVNLFRTAASMTASNTIDHVVANAGIAIEDEVFSYEGMLPFHPSNRSHLQLLNMPNPRSGIPTPTPKPQNHRREPPWHPLHDQARPPHLHQAKRFRRTLTISTTTRYQPDSHRLRSRVPRLPARSTIPEHQMGHPRHYARPPPHSALPR